MMQKLEPRTVSLKLTEAAHVDRIILLELVGVAHVYKLAKMHLLLL